MDKLNLTDASLTELGRIIKCYLNGDYDFMISKQNEYSVLSIHSDYFNDTVHLRHLNSQNFISGDINNGGHFTAFINNNSINIICQQSSNSLILDI